MLYITGERQGIESTGFALQRAEQDLLYITGERQGIESIGFALQHAEQDLGGSSSTLQKKNDKTSKVPALPFNMQNKTREVVYIALHYRRTTRPRKYRLCPSTYRTRPGR